jgi:exosome complex component RRP46
MGHEARSDGRVAAQLRPMASEPGALVRADGSARFAHDQTEVLVSVYGPCEAKRSRERIDGATLELIVRPRMGLPLPADRELEQLLCQTLQHVVLVALHPRTAISIAVQVLANDGALIAAALHGACVALMHAGVPLRGMLGGCTVAVLPDGSMLLDPTAAEEEEARSVVTLAYLIRQTAEGAPERQLILSHMRGVCTAEQYEVCKTAAQEAAGASAAFFRQALARSVAPLAADGGVRQ